MPERLGGGFSASSFSRSAGTARSTVPAARGRDVEVVAGERVAAQALACSGDDSRRPLASGDVLGPRHRFQVSGVHAVANAAEMVEVEAVRDGADVPLINEAVGTNAVSGPDHDSVPVSVHRSLPNPALSRREPAVLRFVFGRVLSSLVAGNESQRLALDRQRRRAGSLRQWRRLATTTRTESFRIWTGAIGSLCGVSARATQRRLGFLCATTTGAGGRLAGHRTDLLHRSGSAVAGGVRSVRRPFALPELYPRSGQSSAMTGGR